MPEQQPQQQNATQPARSTSVGGRDSCTAKPQDPCIRPENEDDDGYDPYSDRRPEPEPLFERDPWG